MSDHVMSNRDVEDHARRLVLDREHQAGREAADVRGKGALADIEGDHLIEVKAFSGSARGSELWLETQQVQAALDHPGQFHLVIVDHIATDHPHVLGITGSAPLPTPEAPTREAPLRGAPTHDHLRLAHQHRSN